MVKDYSKELIGTSHCLTIYTRCRINLCRYNRVRVYILLHGQSIQVFRRRFKAKFAPGGLPGWWKGQHRKMRR